MPSTSENMEELEFSYTIDENKRWNNYVEKLFDNLLKT